MVYLVNELSYLSEHLVNDERTGVKRWVSYVGEVKYRSSNATVNRPVQSRLAMHAIHEKY